MRFTLRACLLLGAYSTAAALEPPDFGIKLADQTFKPISWPRGSNDGPWRIETPEVAAELSYVPDNRWRLRVTARMNLVEVVFPWPGNEPARALTAPDALYYSMYLLGSARRVDSFEEFAWTGIHYPGACHAPLVVCASANEAKLVAATNWPPRLVKLGTAGRGMAIAEERFLRAGDSCDSEIMVAHFKRAQETAQPIWTEALDAYQAWLEPHLRAEGLLPRPPPEWLADSHGWFAFALQNATIFRPEELLRLCEHWQPVLPWVQFWGQMSNYMGPAHLSQPRRKPDELVGCCIDKIGFHERYQEGLPRVAARLAQAGHVGYYQRPLEKSNLETNPEQRKFMVDWFEWSKQNHADAFYIDLIGNEYCGDALTVAKFLRDQTPPATVTEYTMDVYPLPALFSGSLFAGDLKGSARSWRELLAGKRVAAPCPEFGRYLFKDRIIFLGQLNGDHQLSGRQNGYWTERQAFLLGAKLDVVNPWEGENAFGPLNAMVDAIIQERDRVRWWARKPVYRHRAHLEYLPTEIDARVFTTGDGELLIACDNPLRRAGLKLRIAGQDVEVPAVPIRVLSARAPGR